ISKQVSGTSHKRLSRKNLEKIELNVPNIEEQEKIGQLFKKLDEAIAGHEQKLATYQELKKALLQRMFV
ncbi:TPA: restriction endonuclease subunit S, partial [Enterococcus faecium]